MKLLLDYQIYHAVIFHFKIKIKQSGYQTWTHPSKTPRHFGAKTTWADSTLEMAPPLYFLIRIDSYFLLFKNVLKCK